MKITEIKLKNFKRFTDLIIKNIPESAKLVLIVGPNGSGKSSLFDALLHWYKRAAGFGIGGDELYYRKALDENFDWHSNVSVTLSDNSPVKKGSLYIRTAYRNDPDFTVRNLAVPEAPSEKLSIGRAIDNDQSVAQNFQRIVYDTMSGVYSKDNDRKTVLELREELTGRLRSSMAAVFGELILRDISDPLGSGTFYFEKGTVASYHYKNLSGGEKAAFDLLLDIHVKKKFFSDAVYCIDEIETHLHTSITVVIFFLRSGASSESMGYHDSGFMEWLCVC